MHQVKKPQESSTQRLAASVVSAYFQMLCVMCVIFGPLRDFMLRGFGLWRNFRNFFDFGLGALPPRPPAYTAVISI